MNVADSIPSPVTSRDWRAFAIVVIVLLPIAYWRSLGNGWLWDDDYYVSGNPFLYDLAGLRTIWLGILDGVASYPLPQYYPLTFTTFWIEHHLWGDAALGYRVANLVLHAISSGLVFAILRRLRVRGAMLAALLFAVHPLHVESVAWVTERKNVLSGMLGLGAFYAWLRWLDGSRRAYAVGATLFVLALCAKSVVATLPAAFLVVAWWRGHFSDPVGRRAIVKLIPLLAIGAAYGALTGYMEVHRVGASGPEWQFAQSPIGEVGARVQLAGRAVWFYLAKLLVPWPLMFSYPRVPPDALRIVGYVAPLGVVLALVGLWIARPRIGVGAVVAFALFCGLLTPALGLTNVLPMRYSFVADHFCYLASVPMLAGVAWLLVSGIDAATCRYAGSERTRAGPACASGAGPARVRSGPAYRRSIVVGVGLIVGCFTLTFVHAAAFHDARTLWLDTIAHNPQSWLAINNLGLIEMNAGDVAAARARFEHVLRDVKPDHRESMLNLAELDRRAGDEASAARRIDALLATHADYGAAWQMRGELLERAGDPAATAAFARAAASTDAGPAIWTYYARALMRARRVSEATTWIGRALRFAPRSADAWLIRAQLASTQHDVATARRAADAADALEPDRADVLNTLALLDAGAGDAASAERRWRAAIASRPDAFEPTLNLAILLDQLGRREEAVGFWRRAAAIRPGDARVKARLAN